MAGPPANPIATYLRRKAEPEAQAADRLEGRFGHALVIPAYGEGENLFATLGSVPRGPLGEVLIVLVLNARADSPECVHETNRATRDRLLVAGAARPLAGDAGILQVPLPHGRLILVDRARPGGFLPEGQGVGLARKLGADLALRARADGRLASDWIHTTDADALLPDDYFDRTEGVAEAAAAVYPFEHRFDPDERLARAARLHEIALRYRVLGLAWAGSPYAYQSLGSCLAVRSAPYTDVGGFPRRDATEDFHLLNRLARTGAIARLPGKPIVVEGRVSDRVRVSTGREVARLSGKGAETFRLLHPAVFAHLAAWLEVLNAIARDPHDLAGAISRLPSESTFFRRELLTTSLERLDAFRALREAVDEAPETTLRARLHRWLDAVRTQRLLESLRGGGLPSLSFRQALSEAPFTGLSTSTEEEPEALRRELASREEDLAGISTGVGALEH
jgi:hypothetical protein